MNLEIIGDIIDIETIATGSSIRELARLRKFYGGGRWRKLKGIQNKAHSEGPDMTSKRTESSFVVCVSNEAYPASLEVRKIYRVVQDAAATARQMIRVIDESGEDYLYPQHFFAAIRLSKPLVEALALAA